MFTAYRTERHTITWLNFLCFSIGMAGVWFTTHSWPVMGWAFIATLHFTVTVKREADIRAGIDS